MKLDFSTLTQPAGKARGQVGTTGTPAFTRVAVSPVESRGLGTAGDKPATAVHAPDLPVVVPATRPQVSPACPPVPTLEKPNGGAVSPVFPLVPVSAVHVAAVAHRAREDGGGKTPTAAMSRPNRLTRDEADHCHAPCWDDAEIAAFTARAARFEHMGREDADDLAERLTLRDRDGDDRRLCLECTWLGETGRCVAAASGRVPGADRRLEPVQTILQRCDAFGLRKGLT